MRIIFSFRKVQLSLSLTVLIFLVFNSAFAIEKQWPREKMLWGDFNTSLTNKAQIESLDALAYYYLHVQGDFSTVDTIAKRSIEIGKKSKDQALLLKSYDTFFSYNLRGRTLHLANQHLSDIYALGREAEWHYRLFQAMAYNKEHKFKAGAQAAKFSIDLAKTEEQKIRSITYAGINSAWAKDNLTALNYLLEAQDMLELSENDRLKIMVYSSIQQLYDFNKNEERAIFYCEKLIQAILESETIDSAALFEAKYRYLNLRADSGVATNDLEKEALKSLEIAKRNGYTLVYQEYWGFLRSRYISSNNIKRLYELLIEIYPEEFIILKQNEKEKYYRLSALFF